jgi:hypothetical protein
MPLFLESPSSSKEAGIVEADDLSWWLLQVRVFYLIKHVLVFMFSEKKMAITKNDCFAVGGCNEVKNTNLSTYFSSPSLAFDAAAGIRGFIFNK